MASAAPGQMEWHLSRNGCTRSRQGQGSSPQLLRAHSGQGMGSVAMQQTFQKYPFGTIKLFVLKSNNTPQKLKQDVNLSEHTWFTRTRKQLSWETRRGHIPVQHSNFKETFVFFPPKEKLSEKTFQPAPQVLRINLTDGLRWGQEQCSLVSSFPGNPLQYLSTIICADIK